MALTKTNSCIAAIALVKRLGCICVTKPRLHVDTTTRINYTATLIMDTYRSISRKNNLKDFLPMLRSEIPRSIKNLRIWSNRISHKHSCMASQG